jgi:hypothetical protein
MIYRIKLKQIDSRVHFTPYLKDRDSLLTAFHSVKYQELLDKYSLRHQVKLLYL